MDFLAKQTIAAARKIVFSDPIEKNGITIITVSKISYGYGFGGGFDTKSKNKNKKEGGGMGLGIVAKPIGYIKIKNEEVVFEPIEDPASVPLILLTSGIAGFLLLRAVRKIFK